MKHRRIVTSAALSFLTALCFAQDGAYSGYAPYSIFAMGDLSQQGSAYNMGMGGTGIAGRNHRYINTLNPAAVTARDSLAFMADFDLQLDNKYYKQGDVTTVNNNFNIKSFTLTFPIYRSSAMMVGLAPYSTTGYGYYTYVTDQNIVGKSGNVVYSSSGQGAVYQLYVGAGVTLWDNLSLGVEGIHYFGDISKTNTLTFSNSTYNGLNSGYNLDLKANTVKLGVQYEQKLGSLDVCLGATYKFATDFKGTVEDYRISSGSVLTDTLKYNIDTLAGSGAVSMASEIGLGISVRQGERWRAEFNYLRSDWTNTGIGSTAGFSSIGETSFMPSLKQSFRLGFEITPNINDVRYYFRRCAYRAGAYFDKEYYTMDGNNVFSAGITLGTTLPIFRMYNGVSFAMNLGQRWSLSNNGIRERFVGFSIGVNTFDIWFQKHRYN